MEQTATHLTAETSEEAPALSVTLARRLWFLWGVVVAACVTLPMCIAQVISHRFHSTARNFKRWATRWARGILFGLGLRVELTEAAPLDPSQPYVFVANHQNALDIVAIAARLPYPFGFVAKGELSHMPLIGFALRHSASILLDRSEPRRALEGMKEAAQRIREDNSVLIYPEGERSYAAAMGPFKKGAFLLALEAGVPLVPLVVCDAYQHLDERRYIGRPGRMHVVVGEPIPTAHLRRRDVPELMDQVRTRMQQMLDAQAQAPSGTEAQGSR